MSELTVQMMRDAARSLREVKPMLKPGQSLVYSVSQETLNDLMSPVIRCTMLVEKFDQCPKMATEKVRVFSDESQPRDFCKECAAKLREAGLS